MKEGDAFHMEFKHLIKHGFIILNWNPKYKARSGRTEVAIKKQEKDTIQKINIEIEGDQFCYAVE